MSKSCFFVIMWEVKENFVTKFFSCRDTLASFVTLPILVYSCIFRTLSRWSSRKFWPYFSPFPSVGHVACLLPCLWSFSSWLAKLWGSDNAAVCSARSKMSKIFALGFSFACRRVPLEILGQPHYFEDIPRRYNYQILESCMHLHF